MPRPTTWGCRPDSRVGVEQGQASHSRLGRVPVWEMSQPHCWWSSIWTRRCHSELVCLLLGYMLYVYHCLNVLLYIFFTLICLYRLASSLVACVYSFCLYKDASTWMNQGHVRHNNLSFYRGIPASYHYFIKYRPSTGELCDSSHLFWSFFIVSSINLYII